MAKWQDGKTAIAVVPSCRLTVLPFSQNQSNKMVTTYF
jgi:hypothetical protein